MTAQPDIRQAPFEKLLESSPVLAEFRTRYSAATATARRDAAEFTYSAAIADDLMRRAGLDWGGADPFVGLLAALAIDPDYPPALLAVGSLEYQLGRKEDALAHARKAVEISPADAVLVCDLGWALVENHRYAEAEACLLQASAMAPGETMAEENLIHLRGLMERPS